MAEEGGEVQLSSGEASCLSPFLNAVHLLLIPHIEKLSSSSQHRSEGNDQALNLAAEHKAAYAAVIPEGLLRYGFEDVNDWLRPDGDGIPQWVIPLLPQDTHSVIEDAFLTYLAKEVMELHRGNQNEEPTSSAEGIQLLTCERMGQILDSDEELSKLKRDSGFCVSEQLGAHVHTGRRTAQITADEPTLKALESACRTGTAVQVLELLSQLGIFPCDSPLVRGCDAGFEGLPRVPSQVAAPNFEMRQPRITLDGSDVVEEESEPPPEERAQPMLVVACHAGNLEVAQLLVQRFGASTLEHDESAEAPYCALAAAVLTNPNLAIVELLAAHGARMLPVVHIRTRGLFGWSMQTHPLLNLAIRNRVDSAIILVLLAHGALEALKGEDKRMEVLQSAAKAGRVDIMQALLDTHGLPPDLAPPEVSDDEFDNSEHRVYTPLMGAVANQQPAAAELLLERKADPNLLFPSATAVTQYNTPIRIAAQRGDAACIRVLAKHGASWSTMSDCFLWGDRYPSRPGQVELQDALVGYGTSGARRAEAVEALLSCGAQVAAHGSRGGGRGDVNTVCTARTNREGGRGVQASPFLLDLAHGRSEHVPHQWKELDEETRTRVAGLLCGSAAGEPAAKAARVEEARAAQ